MTGFQVFQAITKHLQPPSDARNVLHIKWIVQSSKEGGKAMMTFRQQGRQSTQTAQLKLGNDEGLD